MPERPATLIEPPARLSHAALRTLSLPTTTQAGAIGDEWLLAFVTIANQVSAAATDLLRMHVRLTIEVLGAVAPAWTVVLRSNDDTLAIALDIAACQALLAPVMQDYSPTGTEALDEVELGLLEYVALGVVRRLGGVGAGADGWRIESIGITPESLATPRLGFRLQVGLQSGTLSVSVPADATPPTMTNDDAIDTTGSLSVRLGLPLISLTDIEQQMLEPGDCIVLPMTGLVDAECDVIVGAGRRAGRARIVDALPDVLRFQFVDVGLFRARSDACFVTIGAAQRSIRSIGEWDLDVELDVPAEECLLWSGSTPRWQGELLKLDGKLALRLLQKVDA